MKPNVDVFDFKYSDVIRTSSCFGEDSTPHINFFNDGFKEE